MFKDLFGFSNLLDVPIFVMFFFMAIFALVLIRALSRRRAPHYAAMSRLPLEGTAESPTGTDTQEEVRT